MLDQALAFLLDVVFGLVTYAFLLRFAMQWLRAPFRNPLGQAVVALTDWAVKPARKVIRGYRGLDGSTLLLAWVSQFAWLCVIALVLGPGGFDGMTWATFALLACVDLVKALIWLLIIVVIVQAVLSWVAPDGPFAGTLNAMTFRFLAPIRRVVPPIGGALDLSPLILIVVLQLILILPVSWLESAVVTLFREVVERERSMAKESEVRWDRLTAPELQEAVQDKTVVIVPLGATEQHGPHLPVQVDWRSAYEISMRAARLMAGRQRALVTPAIPFGMSEHHMSLGGTLTLDYSTMAAVVGCVVRSAARHGFERIFVLNGHGGNIAALEVMLTELTIELELPLAGGTYWHIAAKSIREILEHQTQLIHACEAETSILQALSPELV